MLVHKYMSSCWENEQKFPHLIIPHPHTTLPPPPPTEHDMDSKNQDHLQEVERMQQDSTLGQQRLQHEARLKKEMKEVSGTFSHLLLK